MKTRITITITVEYEQQPSLYAEADRTPERMLAVDLQGAKDDPYLFMEMDIAVLDVTGQVIE